MIIFDFNVPYTLENYGNLKNELEALKDVSVLVNNVGQASSDEISKSDFNDLNSMIQTNIVS